MRSSLKIFTFFVLCAMTAGYQTLLRQIFGSALMGDLLATLPSRFQCVGSGKNFSHFHLYNRVHPDKSQPLVPGDQDLLYKSDFDSSVPTKVIVHGFVDNMHISDWMQRMKTKFLSTGDYNVIIVDWSCGNEFPYYQAIQNSKVTASELTKLISFLQENTGADAGSFHLIGHSLGSHIAALVGHSVPHLGRISALDPAGPRFYDVPLEERLDPSDADFVDAIHTDAGHGLLEGLGMKSQVGHVDFYPNGGKDQPGCHNSPFTILPKIGLHRAARYYITCDHFRSVEYFIDSIRSPIQPRLDGLTTCQHVGVACRDWETYAQGRCADCSHPGDCALMGYFSNLYLDREPHSTLHEYYVKTSDEEPFCLFQYQVIVETGCEQGFCGDTDDFSKPGFNPGIIQLELKTSVGKLIRLNLDDKTSTEMKPGGQYVYLATSRYPIQEIQGAKVWWGYSSKPDVAATSSASTGLNLKKIEVVPIDLQAKIKRFSQPPVTVLCGSANKTIGKNQYLELPINSC